QTSSKQARLLHCESQDITGFEWSLAARFVSWGAHLC
ncbi:hypothetical protein ABIE32_003922, partial [Comamonas sp. 4034]